MTAKKVWISRGWFSAADPKRVLKRRKRRKMGLPKAQLELMKREVYHPACEVVAPEPREET